MSGKQKALDIMGVFMYVYWHICMEVYVFVCVCVRERERDRDRDRESILNYIKQMYTRFSCEGIT